MITVEELVRHTAGFEWLRVWQAWNRGLPEHCLVEMGRMRRRVARLRDVTLRVTIDAVTKPDKSS